jgi:hypothetical protein
MKLSDDTSRYLRVVRVMVDSFQLSIDEAIARAGVPAELEAEVRAAWDLETSQIAAPARILSAAKGGRLPWFKEWDPAQGYYWRRLRSYLIDSKGRPLTMVDSLDTVTDRILANLEDPRSSGAKRFRVQGLVVGYVQSGKTANYSALITKAADAGYKLVIVLAGIHNELRRQTQVRLNAELGIGAEGSKGVGEPVAGKKWVAITTPDLHGDFRAGTVDASILQGNDHVLAVVKKNGPVLRRLIAWMSGKVPANLPVLIIDDEADQASINTRGNRAEVSETLDPEDRDSTDPGNETEPSVINGLIRELIKVFSRVSFVAYTATPFANCLIGHDAEDRELYEDLYPRDFIVSLPRPPTYFGAERLFGRPALPNETSGIPPLDVIRVVPDGHLPSLIPESRAKAARFKPSVPPSLRNALCDFIVGLAARYQRGQADQPTCMLVHIHHQMVVQERLRDAVDEELKNIRNAWRYGSGVPDLEDRWKDMRRTIRALDESRDISFDKLRPHLDQIFREPVRVMLLNSGSDDVLDYEREPDLKAVIIGGNRLSRGLTLEGLLVSYFVRDTSYYDTLMQMGRWFGYRSDYVDVTRLWTTPELISNFRDLALAEEELRHEIARYEHEQLTPRDFGPKIRTHPAMLVTAKNKMGAGRVLQQSYSARLLNTLTFRLSDSEWLNANLEATRALIRGLGTPTPEDDLNFTWEDVDAEDVVRFLNAYKAVPSSSFDIEPVRKYIAEQRKRGELSRWIVSIRSRRDSSLGTEDLGMKNRVNMISRTRLANAVDNIGSLVNPVIRTKRGGDEELGLSDTQVKAALEACSRNPDLNYGDALRMQRDPSQGVLLLYPISRSSRPRSDGESRLPLFDDESAGVTVVGIALSFPGSRSPATIEYIANLAGAT